MQSNLTKSFPLFLADGEDRTGDGREKEGTGKRGWRGLEREVGNPYVKIRLEKLYEGQL